VNWEKTGITPDDIKKEAESTQNGENEAAQDVVEKEVDRLAGESSVPSGDKGELPGKATADAIDKDLLDSVYARAETGLPEVDEVVNLAEDQDEGTVNDAANDHRLSVVKDTPKEVPIEYLKNPANGRIFAVNENLLRRKDLIPCDEDGNKVYDHRKIGRFN
jgi:hypothetical protein